MFNLQNALRVAGKFLSNDKINQALALSKTVNSPQSAIKALSTLGDPNQILDDGLNKLNSPTARRMASMFGASDKDLEDLKNQIIGIKNQAPQVQSQYNPQPQRNNQNPVQQSTRLQDLLNGLK